MIVSYNFLSTGKCQKDKSSSEGDGSCGTENSGPRVKCLQQISCHVDTNEALKCTSSVHQAYSTDDYLMTQREFFVFNVNATSNATNYISSLKYVNLTVVSR